MVRVENPNTQRVAIANPIRVVDTSSRIQGRAPSRSLLNFDGLMKFVETANNIRNQRLEEEGQQAFAHHRAELLEDLPEDRQEREAELRRRFSKLGIRGSANPFFQRGFFTASGEAVAQEYRRRGAAALDALLTSGEVNEAGGIIPIGDPQAELDKVWSALQEEAGITLHNRYGARSAAARRAQFDASLLDRHQEKRVEVEERAAKDLRQRTLGGALFETFAADEDFESNPDNINALSERLQEDIFSVSEDPWPEYLDVINGTAEMMAASDAYGPAKAKEFLEATLELRINGTETVADAMPPTVQDDFYRSVQSFEQDAERDRRRALQERDELVQSIAAEHTGEWAAALYGAETVGQRRKAFSSIKAEIIGMVPEEGEEDVRAELLRVVTDMEANAASGFADGTLSVNVTTLIEEMYSDPAMTGDLAQRELTNMLLGQEITGAEYDRAQQLVRGFALSEELTSQPHFTQAEASIRVADIANLPRNSRVEARNLERDAKKDFYDEFMGEAEAYRAENPRASTDELNRHMARWSKETSVKYSEVLTEKVEKIESDRLARVNAVSDLVESGSPDAWGRIVQLRDNGDITVAESRLLFDRTLARNDGVRTTQVIVQDLTNFTMPYLPVDLTTNEVDAGSQAALRTRLIEVEKEIKDEIDNFNGTPAERSEFLYQLTNRYRDDLFERFADETNRAARAIGAAGDGTIEENVASAKALVAYKAGAEQKIAAVDLAAASVTNTKDLVYLGNAKPTGHALEIVNEFYEDLHDRPFFDLHDNSNIEGRWGRIAQHYDSLENEQEKVGVLSVAVNNLGVPWRDVIDGGVWGFGKEHRYMDFKTEQDRATVERGGQAAHLKVQRVDHLDIEMPLEGVSINPYYAPLFESADEIEAFFDGDFNQGQYGVAPLLERLGVPWDQSKFPRALDDPFVQEFVSYQLTALRRVGRDA